MTWRLVHPDDTHYTHDDGRRWPRVSTVLGEWRRCAMPASIPEHVLAEAARLGSVVHAGIASVLTGAPVTSLPTISPRSAERAARAVNHWARWQGLRRLRPVAVEHRLIDERGEVIGTADVIGTVEDARGNGVIDWKTGALYLGGRIALAKYMEMAHEAGFAIEWGRLVRLEKDDGAPFEEKHFTYEQLAPEREAFRLLRQLHAMEMTDG